MAEKQVPIGVDRSGSHIVGALRPANVSPRGAQGVGGRHIAGRCKLAKPILLKDGTEVMIRPLTRDDIDLSVAFFGDLPREDLNYLRGDPSRREVAERRIQEMESGECNRLVAIAGGKIIAEGTLMMSGRDWTAHVGELRLIVAREFQRKGLGMLMAHELYSLAARCKLEKIMVTMMRPQTGARSIFRKLGFREELVLPDHVKDRNGKYQDLIIMRCDLRALWQELEALFGEAGPAGAGQLTRRR